MSEDLFRKKSLEKMNTPEALNDYIQVSNPGMWLLIASIIILLVGACIWGVYGHVDTVIEGKAIVKDGEVSFYVPIGEYDRIPEDVVVRIGEEEYHFIYKKGNIEISEENIKIGNLQSDLTSGEYNCEVVIESIKPVSFVLN